MKIRTLVSSGSNLRLARAGARQMRFGSFLSLLVAGAVLLGLDWGAQRCAAQVFPAQGDDTTSSMGVFRVTVAPAFRPLVDGSGGWLVYTGFNPGDGRLTSPLCIDNTTTIGRSGPNTRPYAFPPVPIGAGSWDTISGYGDYALIPALWTGAPVNTEEVLTEIKSFILSSVGAGTAGQHCPPDPRIPDVPINWPMVKAGTFAGVTPRSLGIVQENVANGAASPDFPAHSFFDIFVEVSLPPIPGTKSSVAFPVGGALFYNDSPLVITNLSLTSFPPTVIYIHGETPAVPLKFKVSNPPYWNAGDLFGYLVLAGHGTITSDCNNTTAVNTLLTAVLGPVGASIPEAAVEWPRTNTLFPSPGVTYDSLHGTNFDGSSLDVVSFTVPGGTIQTRSFSIGNFPSPISPPAPSTFATYSVPSTLATFDYSFDGLNWNPSTGSGPATIKITNTTGAGSTSTFDTEMLLLNLTAGTLMIRESPTKQSLGKHTIRTDGSLYRISSFFDVFLELSTDNGATWVPANRALRVQDSPPPPPALSLTCPANITVAATSPAGAVVSYTDTVSGGCPPVSVVCNPPSGSTFPIGTTMVTCTASDACGQVADCSFTVTVNPQNTPQAPEYFFHQPVLPPIGSVYISPELWHVLFNNGIIIRDVRHRFFTQNYPLPPLGTSQAEFFSSEVDFDLSTDNGNTFQPASGAANVTVQVTHSQDANGYSFFDTEMLQLDLSSGSLPAGVMIRESPTLQSTGQTTVRPVAGGYMVSSFFDVFTEVTTDGGISWTPAQQAGHVEMHPDPKQVTPVAEPTTLLPPPNGAYVSPEQWHALFAQGIVIKDVSHRLFTGASQPPTPGTPNTENFDSQIDLQVSTDGGNTYQAVRVAAPVQVTVASHGSSTDTIYDTEMTMLSVNLPNGVMIRESPTLPSRGQTAIEAQTDGTYQVTSFFDIFTELSLDGGASWSPATNGAVRVQLVPIAPEVPKPTPNLPPLDGSYVSPAQWHALYANGIIITNASHDRFTQTQPPPPPGGSQTEGFGSRVSGQISMNGGASFTPFQAPASVGVQVSSRADEDTGSTRFFDTEMLSLSLSGGTLPGGVMVRESPSKASLGRTSVRTTATGYQVSSFFDIFTEVSLDGGATWSPSVTAPGTMGLASNGPPPPLILTCPADMTVVATSPAGAVVMYTDTVSGGCPPVSVVCNPPSGSTFPIGTTTVTCMASDACGQSANCSFTVTVNAPTPEYFFPQAALPPAGSVYISPELWHVLFAQGIVIRDVRHAKFTQTFPLPPLGTSQTETFGSALDFEVSYDGGATFQPVSGTANVTVQVTHSQDVGSQMFFDTEMLQLDLTSGTLMLRESPTLQSTGQTTVRPVTGGYMISSFFDVFTEVSTDGGQTWMATSQPGHVEMHPDPQDVAPVSEPTPILPPPNGAYVSPQQWHALYAQGIVIKDVSHRLFTDAFQPPASGTTDTHTFDSQIDLQVSTDGGNTYQALRVAAPVQVSVASHGSSANTIYDTEMTMLSINLPNGVMIRESPTEPSRGQAEITAQSDGTYKISSFFDIFTELSLDGGASWAEATNGPVRVELVPVAVEVPKPTPNLPPLDGDYVSPDKWHALYANGIIITNASHDRFTQTQPPPPPGGSQTENFGSQVSGLISMNGGASFTPFSAPANVAVQVNSRADEDNGSTRFFDTEMLSLSLSGGNLPGGVMVRESPSKASLGRTSVRATATGYEVSSFFDVFTEVSLDGGATWSPSVTAPGTMGLTTAPPIALTCSPNLTVATTSAAGAVVTYSSSASGGCPPVTLSYSPPSGSTFPIGTTTVTCTASDGCGQVATCEFTVTVVSLTLTIQPAGNQKVKVTWTIGTLQQADKVQGPYIDIDPQPTSPWTNTPVGGKKFFRVRSGQPGFTFYDTEMLQLDISGGNLPAGMMIRESPTLASTGKTAISPATGGGYIIDSFFDVFTELSLDNGNTWQASTSAPPRMRFTGVAPDNSLPPKDANYVSPADWHAAYAQGIYLTNASHLQFTSGIAPPPPGGATVNHTFSSTVNMQLRLTPNGALQSVSAPASVTVKVTSRP
jgi:hypothetical protein